MRELTVTLAGGATTDRLTVALAPNVDGEIAPEIARAVVVKLKGADPLAGEVVELPAPSVDVTRMKYVVLGARPVSVTECDRTEDELDAVCVRDEEFVPYDTSESLGSLVDHVTAAVVEVGVAPIPEIVGAVMSTP